MLFLFRLLLLTVLLAGSAPAQAFGYSDFSNVAGLAMNGGAQQSGNALRVCSNVNGDKGSVFYDQSVYVSGGFATKFIFATSNPVNGGGDGLTFIVQNDPNGLAAMGDSGSAMGYGGFATSPANAIDNALVIEVDTFFNSSWNDPDGNHISVQTGGTGDCSQDHDSSIAVVSPAFTLQKGSHILDIQYDGSLLEIYLDGGSKPVISVAWSFAGGGTYLTGGSTGGLNLMSGGNAYVGFSAGSSTQAQDHDILSWKFISTPVGGPIGTNYCGPANLNSTGASAAISAWGQTIAAANDVRLDVGSLPLNQFGMFVTSQTKGFIPNPGGSQGNLCLGGAIGRYSKSLVNSGSAGQFSLQLDLTQTPTPAGPVVIQAGETWHFQTWYRDKNPTNTSNFTDGISITFM
ncbi:MAG TPA: hypothetical protein EYQ74_05090 [Planctomycetes bacterium]|nr:hypothetical protein [Planctomycetota bacterium]HIK59233.1 hypothetical protein [Planctomycetota bacterium]